MDLYYNKSHSPVFHSIPSQWNLALANFGRQNAENLFLA